MQLCHQREFFSPTFLKVMLYEDRKATALARISELMKKMLRVSVSKYALIFLLLLPAAVFLHLSMLRKQLVEISANTSAQQTLRGVFSSLDIESDNTPPVPLFRPMVHKSSCKNPRVETPRKIFYSLIFDRDNLLQLFMTVAEVGPYVDRIFLVEGELSFQLEDKKVLGEKTINKYLGSFHNFEYILLSKNDLLSAPSSPISFPVNGSTAFEVERYARFRQIKAIHDYLSSGKTSVQDDDVIVVADVDEILSQETLISFRQCNFFQGKTFTLVLRNHGFKVNCYLKKVKWAQNVVTWGHVKSNFQRDLSSAIWRTKDAVSVYRNQRTDFVYKSKNYGWHMSSMCMDTATYIRKWMKFSHVVSSERLLKLRQFDTNRCRLPETEGKSKYNPSIFEINSQTFAPRYVLDNLSWFQANGCFSTLSVNDKTAI